MNVQFKSRSNHVALLTAFLVMAVASPSWAVEDNPWAIPVGEAGLLTVVDSSPTRPLAGGGNHDGATRFALGMRAEASLLGLFPIFSKFRIGELLGVDLGLGMGFTTRILIGGQATYEFHRDFGFGLRGYSMSTLTLLRSDLMNQVIGEVSGRYKAVIARARFSVRPARGGMRDLGLSVRFPTTWRIKGYTGWLVGLDYDRVAFKDVYGDTQLHRVIAAVVYPF